jgi:hypothetical protein
MINLVTKTSFVTFFHQVFLEIVFITSFPQPHALLQLDSGLFFCSINHHHHIQLTTYCLPYIRLPKFACRLQIHFEDGNCNVC